MPLVRLFYSLNQIQGMSVSVQHKYVCMCVYGCDGYTYRYVYGVCVHVSMCIYVYICMCVMSGLIYACVHVYTLCRHVCVRMKFNSNVYKYQELINKKKH